MIFARRLIAALFLALALAAPAAAAENPLDGHDPVAYFTAGKPTKGDKQWKTEWQGKEYHFVSSSNRDAFAADPEKYAPQFGGFCAWAVSQGYTAPVDPNAWRIVEGKLYLNYSKSVQRTWEKDIPGNIKKANENWPKLAGK